MSISTRSHRQDVDNILQTPPLSLFAIFSVSLHLCMYRLDTDSSQEDIDDVDQQFYDLTGILCDWSQQ